MPVSQQSVRALILHEPTPVPISEPRRSFDFARSEKNPACRDWSFFQVENPKPLVMREDWFFARFSQATYVLREQIDLDPEIMGGMPVLKGTRIPLARIFAEIADGLTIVAIAEDFDLEPEHLKGLMDGMACYFGRPAK